MPENMWAWSDGRSAALGSDFPGSNPEYFSFFRAPLTEVVVVIFNYSNSK